MDTPPLSLMPANNPSAEATWSIAEVERDTGLRKDTLRVWERRYGFPAPSRDGAGERAYPTPQVHRLRLLKRLLDVGHRPGKVVPLSTAELQALLQALPGAQRRTPRETGSCDVDPASGPATPWLDWLNENRTDQIRQALHQHILRQGLGAVVEDVIAPLCVQVGQAWLRGELPIYQEHLLTETLQTALREAMATLDARGAAQQHRPRVLLTTTPTEQHGLGLLMAECFFAMEACERLSLGVSTPMADIVLAVRPLSVDVLALSFSAHASRREVVDSLQQLRAQLPAGVEIWVGGAGAALLRRGLPEGVSVLGKAGDVSRHVRDWRLRHGYDRA